MGSTSLARTPRLRLMQEIYFDFQYIESAPEMQRILAFDFIRWEQYMFVYYDYNKICSVCKGIFHPPCAFLPAGTAGTKSKRHTKSPVFLLTFGGA